LTACASKFWRRISAKFSACAFARSPPRPRDLRNLPEFPRYFAGVSAVQGMLGIT